MQVKRLGRIQSLPSVESSNRFLLTPRKSSCNSVMGRTGEGASSFGRSPQLLCSLLTLSSTVQPLCSSLFASSAFSSLLRFPRMGSGGLLCTPCCPALVPTETHTTACCDQGVCLPASVWTPLDVSCCLRYPQHLTLWVPHSHLVSSDDRSSQL